MSATVLMQPFTPSALSPPSHWRTLSRQRTCSLSSVRSRSSAPCHCHQTSEPSGSNAGAGSEALTNRLKLNMPSGRLEGSCDTDEPLLPGSCWSQPSASRQRHQTGQDSADQRSSPKTDRALLSIASRKHTRSEKQAPRGCHRRGRISWGRGSTTPCFSLAATSK